MYYILMVAYEVVILWMWVEVVLLGELLLSTLVYCSMEQVNNLREVQALRKLNPHPNIIELIDVIL